MMLAAAAKDPAYEGHIVNTASMAGLLNPPNMGVYNVSKHAVVSMSETLYQDLRLVTEQIGASVLCPFFVPTGITESQRNRPHDARRRQADQEPADRQGDERSRRRSRQGQRRRRRRLRLRRHRRAAASTSTATRSRSRACRRGSRTSSRRGTRPIRSPASRRSAPSCALRCARLAPAQQPIFTACTGRPVAASTTTRLTLRGCAASAGVAGLKRSVSAAPLRAAQSRTGS